MDTATTQELVQLFNYLHDGSMERYEAQPAHLVLWINCPYLAERVRLRLCNLTHFRFLAWDEAPGNAVLTSMAQVFASNLEILDATHLLEFPFVRVACAQHDPAITWSGGMLELACQAYDLADEAGNQLSLAALRQLAQDYWADF